jgi:nitrous oxidase accessory protein NosD
MKRITVLVILMCAMTVVAFAQSFTVQSVTGRVQQEKGGSRIDVKAGDTLAAETIIHTGVGASLVLKEGEKTFTVTSARSGKVAELTAAAPGVRISGTVARTDTGAVNRTTAQASTASARASEAAGDGDIAAE